jgi:hypothetical protein
MDCPYVSPKTNDQIKTKLIEVKAEFKETTRVRICKCIVLDYLLDENEKIKFYDWKIEKTALYKRIMFTTYKRTLFNGFSKRDNDIIEDEY